MYHCFFIFVVFLHSLIKHSGYDAILPCFFLLTLFAPPLGLYRVKKCKIETNYLLLNLFLASSTIWDLHHPIWPKGTSRKNAPFFETSFVFLSSSSSPVCESIDISGGGPKQGQVLVMRRLLSIILDYLWVLLRSTKFSYSVGGIRMDGMVMNVQSNWRAIKGYIISKKVRSSQSLSVSSWAKGLLFTFLKLRRRSALMWVHVRDIETCVWPSLCDWPSLKRHRRIKKDIGGQSSA